MQENEQGELQETEQSASHDTVNQVHTAQVEQIEALRSLWGNREHIALVGDYNYAVLTASELWPAMNAFYNRMWVEDHSCDVNIALSEAELAARTRMVERFASVFQLHLGLFERDRFIGWCWGRQESPEEFHMVSTALLPEYRGRGIYTALLPEVITRVQAEGFQSIFSWHHPDNSGILVPKLKAGFVISGFRVWDRFGLLVQLTYPFNDTRRELFSYRIGHTRLTDRIAPLFK